MTPRRVLLAWIPIVLAVPVLLAALVALSYWRSGAEPLDDVAMASTELGTEFRSERVRTNGIELHVVSTGPEQGSPIILLHGFPEYWWGWRKQAAMLGRAGFHVIVPDQRGYNLSDKPAATAAYATRELVQDLLGLADALGFGRFALVGHDWGGEIAWRFALAHPERLDKLVIFNAPFPGSWSRLRAASEAGAEEEDAGSYRDFFQIPWIPEIALRLRDWNGLVSALRGTSRPGTFDEGELAHYRGAWSQPGAATAMVNWYRNGFIPPAEDARIEVPTRVVWGMLDPYFPSQLAELSASLCTSGELVQLEEFGHWLLHEDPELTSRQILDFLRPEEVAPDEPDPGLSRSRP